jgi:hypothetical protein
MRLLKFDGLSELSLTKDLIEDIPSYAILSHTWGADDDEVTFTGLKDGSAKSKPGYTKVQFCGEQARRDGLQYFWVDTCCTDKSSSAELSEAINSMFGWYKNASVCYAYLSDVSTDSGTHAIEATFKRSRWFERGWTLQELLAPSEVIFFSREWQRIGTKRSQKEYINETTGINITALDGVELGLYSVAERMSWAAHRKTTRIEDIAYSLMGIFDVNMPLLYGEKEKAFLRLQEEIIKTTTDQSLLAWKDSSIPSETYTGLLARSPDYFAQSGNISSLGFWGKNGEFSFTNKGMSVDLFLVPYLEEQGIFRAALDCRVHGSFSLSPAIYLKRLSTVEIGDDIPRSQQYSRIHAGEIDMLDAAEKVSGQYGHVLVKHNHAIPYQQSREMSQIKLFLVKLELSKGFGLGFKYGPDDKMYVARDIISHGFPLGHWNPQTMLLHSTGNVGKLGGLVLNNGIKRGLLFLGLSAVGRPWCHIKQVSRNPDEEWSTYHPNVQEQLQSQAVLMIETERQNTGRALFCCFCARISVAEVYRTPVFIVHICSWNGVRPPLQSALLGSLSYGA